MYVNGYCGECYTWIQGECLCPENQPYLDYVHQSELEACKVEVGEEWVEWAKGLEALEGLQ